MADTRRVIAIIGGGPRGASVLERLNAQLPADAAVDIHIFEPFELGAGRVWRTDQSTALVMNTYAGQVTLFTDEALRSIGPTRPGPDLLTWVSGDPVGQEALRRYESGPLQAWSHPTRALFGAYLGWFAQRAIDGFGPQVSVTHHRVRVSAVTPAGERFTVTAASLQLQADAVVLALGWLDRDSDVYRPGHLTWVAPASPIEQSLDLLQPDEPVAVRGLGMGFYDAMVLLTEGRGGRFTAVGPVLDGDHDGPQRLRYEPSGREPRLFIGSRSGIPFRSKSVYRALPPRSDAPRTDAAIAAARRGDIDFAHDLLPAIGADAQAAYAATRAALPDPAAEPESVDLAALEAPHVPDGSDAYAQWFTQYLDDDLREAARGAQSPLKAAAWVIASQRARIADLASFGGLSADSYPAYERYLAFGGKLGSGPPNFRNAQLLALIEAGLVVPFGPDARLRMRDDGTGELRAADGTVQQVSAVLDAWMHRPTGVSTTDALVRSLLDEGLARAYVRPGAVAATEALHIDPHTARLVAADGTCARALYSIGIPQEDARGYSLISPIPRSNAALLRETDAVAHDIVSRLFTA